MELDSILKLVLFAISHWVLAVLLLYDLAKRKRVLGGRKWPWAVVMIFITFLGSLLYLVCHPQVLFGGSDDKGGSKDENTEK